MTWPSGEFPGGLLLLLGKGAAWLLFCVLLRALMPRRGPSWRMALTALGLLSAVHLLPALWIWTLPRPAAAENVSAAPAAPTLPAPAPAAGSRPSQDFPSTAPAPRFLPVWSWQDWLGLLWLGGTGGLLCWLLTGFLTVRRWVRQALPLTDPRWQQSLSGECRRLALRRPPRLLLSSAVPGPGVTGCLRPALLLPPSCLEWDEETRTMVLRHELAHLRRGDPWHAWVRSLVLVIHWLNPLVWFAISRSRQAEELAADDAVLSTGAAADRYAATLLFIARTSLTSPSRTPLLTAMAHPVTLEFRIRRLLSQIPAPAPQSPVRFAAAGIALTCAAAGFLGCSSVKTEGPHGNDTDLAGAPTPINSIDTLELKALLAAPPSKAKSFQLICRVIDAQGRELPVPVHSLSKTETPQTFQHSLTLNPGQKSKVDIIREFPYPTKFNPPDWTPTHGPDGGGSFPVTPTTPAEFAFRNIGWEADTIRIRPEGAFLMVSGTFRETTFDGFVRNAGEAFSTITTTGRNAFGRAEEVVLTDNKVLAPCFSQRETPFIVAALPGKPYRLRLNLRQPDAFLEITCTPTTGG